MRNVIRTDSEKALRKGIADLLRKARYDRQVFANQVTRTVPKSLFRGYARGAAAESNALLHAWLKE
jgi:hypothetical protein